MSNCRYILAVSVYLDLLSAADQILVLSYEAQACLKVCACERYCQQLEFCVFVLFCKIAKKSYCFSTHFLPYHHRIDSRHSFFLDVLYPGLLRHPFFAVFSVSSVIYTHALKAAAQLAPHAKA